MKTLKYMMTALLLILVSTACTGQDKSITVNELPAPAQEMIKKHFSNEKITIVLKDKDGLRVSYDVMFNNGTKVEFNSKGEWAEIDTKPQAVPQALVPSAITDYAKKNYPDARIVQIEHDKRGYEINLSNGLEIRFNNQFKVTEIDD